MFHALHDEPVVKKRVGSGGRKVIDVDMSDSLIVQNEDDYNAVVVVLNTEKLGSAGFFTRHGLWVDWRVKRGS